VVCSLSLSLSLFSLCLSNRINQTLTSFLLIGNRFRNPIPQFISSEFRQSSFLFITTAQFGQSIAVIVISFISLLFCGLCLCFLIPHFKLKAVKDSYILMEKFNARPLINGFYLCLFGSICSLTLIPFYFLGGHWFQCGSPLAKLSITYFYEPRRLELFVAILICVVDVLLVAAFMVMHYKTNSSLISVYQPFRRIVCTHNSDFLNHPRW